MSNILKKFRQLLTLKKLTAYILPRTDEHQSEYICQCDQRVRFISGFSGSNAIALILQDEALLWTDGRYFLQAEKQLGQGWQMKKLLSTQSKWFQYLVEKLPKGSVVGVDGRLLTADSAQVRSKFLQQNGITMEFSKQNLVDQVWQDRPKSTATDIFLHEQWAGKSLNQKITWVRNKIEENKGEAALFSDLSEIAWVLNLRSAQIPYNPFFKSILVIKKNCGTLYLPKDHKSLHNQQIKNHLAKQKIQIKQYWPQFPAKILCSKSSLNYSIYSELKEPIQWEGIGLYRCVRAQKQIDGFIRCHVSDAIAMAKFWTWRSKQDSIDQYVAATYLDNLRLKQKHNKGLSFTTISGGGSNAAVIHYHPTQKVSSMITKQMIHLVDSGGQYLDGTTDVTRTFHFGIPTKEEKQNNTRVLRGNLDIQKLTWPKSVKITGADIDILARRYLWAQGLDYLHGTGHGVGYFEGVHQGPIGISKYNKTVFEPGMIVTNQPGYYETGKYGIRIQNMLLIVNKGNDQYGFLNMTLCPYDKNLLDLQQLSQGDRHYINEYHKRVFDTVAPHLDDDKEALQWLKNATSPI